MAGQFLCFVDSGATGDEETDRVPVGYGTTRNKAMAMGIRNGLPELAGAGAMAMARAGFAVVEQHELSAAEFKVVAKVIDDFFIKPPPAEAGQ